MYYISIERINYVIFNNYFIYILFFYPYLPILFKKASIALFVIYQLHWKVQSDTCTPHLYRLLSIKSILFSLNYLKHLSKRRHLFNTLGGVLKCHFKLADIHFFIKGADVYRPHSFYMDETYYLRFPRFIGVISY